MKKHGFISKRILSFKYAFQGIGTLLKTQVNAWIHLLAIIVVVVAGLILGCTSTEWAILMLTIGAVFSAEAMNSAVEFLTDLVSPEYHDLAGKAKDLAAASVLILAIASIGVAVFIFLPKLIAI
ncbi:MAG: diacylglycerol kinase family protein [Bacteroidota bacterium]